MSRRIFCLPAFGYPTQCGYVDMRPSGASTFDHQKRAAALVGKVAWCGHSGRAVFGMRSLQSGESNRKRQVLWLQQRDIFSIAAGLWFCCVSNALPANGRQSAMSLFGGFPQDCAPLLLYNTI